MGCGKYSELIYRSDKITTNTTVSTRRENIYYTGTPVLRCTNTTWLYVAHGTDLQLQYIC